MKWLIGFILHEMAFGLLSVFLPLYITGVLGGSLTDVGIMAASANCVAVPFSFFWGYLSDKTRRYRFYILLSFAGMATLLYLFSLTNVVPLLIGFYILPSQFFMWHMKRPRMCSFQSITLAPNGKEALLLTKL